LIKTPQKKTADRGERLALFADVAFGVGAAAIVTGVVLWLTQGDDSDAQEQSDSSAARALDRTLVLVAPPVRPGDTGVETAFRF